MGIHSNFKTEIGNESSVTGDDATELIQRFSKLFTVDISIFQFVKYFYTEPTSSNPLILLVALGMLLLFFSNILLVSIIYLFNRKASQRVWNSNLLKACNNWIRELDKAYCI